VLAFFTLAAGYLTWAAFADITHGEPDHKLEHTFLCVCAAWFAFVSIYLLRTRHRTLGVLSLIALAAGLWGQREIGPGVRAGLRPSYLATIGAFLWFLVLSGVLVAMSWRTDRICRKT
jgi:hypothetical protein